MLQDSVSSEAIVVYLKLFLTDLDKIPEIMLFLSCFVFCI